MRTLVVDTEFSSLDSEAKLLSIAVVDVQSGAYFYAEILDSLPDDIGSLNGALSDEQLQILGESFGFFVVDNIFPLFDYAKYGMSMAEAASGLHTFLMGFAEPVQLASDSRVWDYPMLEQLLGDDWPSCVPRIQSQMLDIVAESETLRETAELPHHALEEAQMLVELCREKR